MKKAFVVIGLSVVIVALVGYFAVTYFLGGIVKSGVNNFAPKLTQSDVQLAGAQLSPLTGSGTLTGLKVGNPKGWSERDAFYLGKVQLSVEPTSVFRDTIVINELVIDQPEFNYETKIVSSNIQDLLKNIESAVGRGDQVTDKSGKPKKFIVKKFRLTHAKATVGVGPAALPVPLPEVSLDNLGVQENGITGAQLAGAIMRDVLSKIVSATAGALGQLGGTAGATSLEKTKEAAKQVGDAVKDLFKKK
jgi:hypothetical protein